MGERVGIGMGADCTGVMEATKVGKVTGVSSVPTVDSVAQPKSAAQTTKKSAKGIQRFIAGNQACCRLLIGQSSYQSLLFFPGRDLSLDAGVAQPLQQQSNSRALRYAETGQIASVEAWLQVPPFVQVAQG